MHEALLNFCKWLENTPWALAIGRSLWAYPVVQTIHFTGLSLWVGTIVVTDLRLLGLGKGHRSASQFAKQLVPWTWTGFGVALLGGALLFAASASAYFRNPAFQIKFLLLVVGIAYHLVVQRKTATWGETPSAPGIARIAAASELALWICVITAAVEIPNH